MGTPPPAMPVSTYKCDVCDHTSDRMFNMLAHIRARHPGHEPSSRPCGKCGSDVCVLKLESHEQTCTGLSSLQCPTCHAHFDSRQQKHRHIKKQTCVSVNNVNTVNGDHNHIYNTTNSHSNNTTNTTIINLNLQGLERDRLQQVLDFFRTDKDKVILNIHNNPSELQMAHKHGVMHETLTSLTHFAVPENRNILKVDPKTSTMTVAERARGAAAAKPCPIAMVDGIERIIKNNYEIANNPQVKKYLTSDASETLLAPPADTTAYNRLKRGVRRMAMSDGTLPAAVRDGVPDWPPPVPETPEAAVDAFMRAVNVLPESRLRGPAADAAIRRSMGEPLRLVCCNYACVRGEFYKGVRSTGWVLCGTVPEDIGRAAHALKRDAMTRVVLRRDAQAAGRERARLTRVSEALSRFCYRSLADELVREIAADGERVEA